MRMILVRAAIVWMIGVVFIFGHGYQAWGAIKLGTIEVTPSITQEGKWDSNIELGADNGSAGETKKGDYINTLTPAISFNYQRPLIDISLGASLDIIRYDEYSRNDTEDYTLNASAEYGYLGRSGIYVKVNEEFKNAQDRYDIVGFEDERYIEGSAKDKKTNVAGIEVGYGLADRYAFHVLYENSSLHYENFVQDRDLRKTENAVGASLYYRVLPKTFASLGYTYTVTDYPDYNTGGLVDAGKNSKDHNVEVGVLWKEAEKLNGSIKVGYQWKKWDQRQDGAGNKLEDIDGVTVRANVGWLPFVRTTVNLDALVEEVDSIETNYYSYDRYAVGLTINQVIVNRLSCRLGGKYERDEYSGTAGAIDKEFDLYNVNVGITYRFVDWLEAEVSYNYREKDANNHAFTDDEYRDHITMFRITGRL